MPVLDYLKKVTSKKEAAQSPVLSQEDEQFLKRITSEENPPPLPERPTVILDNKEDTTPPLPDRPEVVLGNNAQTTLIDGADKVALPTSPPLEEEDGKEPEGEKKKRNYWSYVSNIPGRLKDKKKEQAAKDARFTTEANLKDDGTVSSSEARKEEEDLTAVLDQLNLAAVNNRVFSFSKESQELLEKFKLVLKDLVNGVPTAYDDLEKLLTNSENQLTKMYSAMPPFLQNLVKSLPSKMTAALAPELLAAASEKPGADAKASAKFSQQSTEGPSKKRTKRSKIPSLKSLVTEQGAVAAMLRTILNFLKLRFPAFMTGTNVLMSLAVFILLFVFWYCHKRGKETRLAANAASSAASAENSESEMEDSVMLDKAGQETKAVNIDEEPPIHFHDSVDVGDKPSAAVHDFPSVLDLPEPSSVRLPDEADKGLEKPSEAEKK